MENCWLRAERVFMILFCFVFSFICLYVLYYYFSFVAEILWFICCYMHFLFEHSSKRFTNNLCTLVHISDGRVLVNKTQVR